MTEIVTARIRAVNVRQEGERVLLLEGGRAILDLPWDAALELARAIHIQAKRAEELAKIEEIVRDQSILARLGIPFGLTNRIDALKEAMKEAAWNSQLRRYIPPGRAGGITSQAVFGAPKIIRHPKRK